MLLLPLALAMALAAALAAPLTIDLVVHGRATAEHGGAVVLRGTLTCSVPTVVTLDAEVVESFKHAASAFGTFSTELACGTAPTLWTVTVSPESGVPFRPGFALADVRVVGFDPESGVFTGVQSLVFLHLTRSPR